MVASVNVSTFVSSPEYQQENRSGEAEYGVGKLAVNRHERKSHPTPQVDESVDFDQRHVKDAKKLGEDHEY